jgi:hypothetical protein
VARSYGKDTIDGKAVDRGIASRMVQHANALVIASYEVQRDSDGKPIVDAFGTPEVVVDESGLPVLLAPEATHITELTRYVGLLDAARQIGKQLGYGPLGGPSDD